MDSYFENFMKINSLFIRQEEKKRTRKMLSMENIDTNGNNNNNNNNDGNINNNPRRNDESEMEIDREPNINSMDFNLIQPQINNNNNNNNNNSYNLQRIEAEQAKTVAYQNSFLDSINENRGVLDRTSIIRLHRELKFQLQNSKNNINNNNNNDNSNNNDILECDTDTIMMDDSMIFYEKSNLLSDNDIFNFDKNINNQNGLESIFKSSLSYQQLLSLIESERISKGKLSSSSLSSSSSSSLSSYSMLNLPQEIIFHIFHYLDVKSLTQVSSTNSLLQLISNDNELWKRIVISRFGGDTSIEIPKPYYSIWKDYYKAFKTYKGVWDSSKKGKIFITNNNRTITHAGDYLGSYQSIRGTEPISSGIVYWEFYINTLNANQTGFHLVVGVVPESFSIWQTYLTSNGGWGYLADGRKANNSGNGVTFASCFVQESTIGCLLDMNKKTLSFYLNGVFQGVAFDNIEGTVYPGVSLLTGGQSVSLVSNPVFNKLPPLKPLTATTTTQQQS
ncbi:hypothetical protein RB653_004604 [Dictyostelium firmibasis]|uniref:F-box domain-containing protein n=1 Tax=Dictyostelium firmibasis TaxID=79012 RepID=A0AAN7TZU4_9MYCE